MSADIGHNNGPAMDSGVRWRTHCWKKARAELLPHLPIEILRGRVRRAKELGLDYTTYASVRASTGRDVVGFLFSGNALRVYRGKAKLAEDRVEKLQSIVECERIAFLSGASLQQEFSTEMSETTLDALAAAPDALGGWSASRRAVLDALKPRRLPADGVLLIGEATLEKEWSEAGKLAGYLPSERYFSAVIK